MFRPTRERHGVARRALGGLATAGLFLSGCAAGSQTGGSAGGNPPVSAGTVSAAEPEDAAPSSSRDASTLTWFPDPVEGVGEVFDLCDDEEAALAGLDGGDLKGDRTALEIDCSTDHNRYGSKGNTGELVLGDTGSPRETAVESEGPDNGLLPPMILGYRPPSDAILSSSETGKLPAELAELPASVSYSEGVLYGLVANNTTRLATNAEVTAGTRTYLAPLSIQPGEAAPFRLAVESQPETGAISVTATLTDGLDLGRSILVYDAPGYWKGPRGDLPVKGPLRQGDQDEDVTLYSTVVDMVVPLGREDLRSRIEGARFGGLVASVAFLDKKGRVIAVKDFRPDSVGLDGEPLVMESYGFGDPATVDFLIPDGAADFVLRVGATDNGS